MGSSKYYLSRNLFVTCNLQLICMPRASKKGDKPVNHQSSLHSILWNTELFWPTYVQCRSTVAGVRFFSLKAEFRGAVTATSPRLLGKMRFFPWKNSPSLRNGWDLHCLQSTSTQLPLHGGLSSGNNHGTSSKHPSSVHGEVRDLLEISNISASPMSDAISLMAWFDSDKGEFSFFFPFFFFSMA